MTKSKNPKSNPIEDAIGNRAKTKLSGEDFQKITTEIKKEVIRTGQQGGPLPLPPEQIPDVPSPSEMLSLEELNRQTEEKLLDDPRRLIVPELMPTEKPIPVSKPDLPPVTTTSIRESPPQKSDTPNLDKFKLSAEDVLEMDLPQQESIYRSIENVREETSKMQEFNPPAEDRDLEALKAYILDNGFVVSGVAFHIVMLCSAPLVTTSTTDWDFEDRQHIPDMVFTLLRQPGYIDGIWPSLRIVMGNNGGNSAWAAGIATSIAFFDVIRTLPTLKEMKK